MDLQFLQTAVARRLLLLLMATALIPISVAGLVAQKFIFDASSSPGSVAVEDATEPVARDLHDRLARARDIVRRLPDGVPPGRDAATVASQLGLRGSFGAVALLDARGQASWTFGEPRVVPAPGAPTRGHGVELRSVEIDGSVRLLFVRSLPDGRSWIAEPDADALWAPLREAASFSGWRVVTAGGREIARFGDAPSAPRAEPAAADSGGAPLRRRLALAGDLGGEDWIVEQYRPRILPTLLGVRFEFWLALMTVASLAAVLGLGLTQIRRIVEPLEHLTRATRKLADGDMSQRVEPVDDDGFDALADAFNEMVERVRKRELDLSRRATRDSLTNLANRHGLQLGLQGMLASPSLSCGLFYIDLDNFKQVNDSQGHEAGDELLRMAATRLTKVLPDDALVARLGGDEFVVVLHGSVPQEIQRYARRCCETLAEAFWLDGVEHFLGASLGVALAPEHGREVDVLLRRADIAMYSAKRAGRNGFAVFASEMDSQARARVQLNRELRHALERREFVLHFQPRVSTVDGHVSSAEALIRWHHPGRGLLMPGLFIGVAEESELIESLGNWVLEEACAQYARWMRDGVTLRRVSVNVSPRQLASGKLPGFVKKMLAQYRVPPQALELEVTESLLVGDVTRSAEQLSEVRRWGVTIALDDFGTGYSSLASLRQLPIDVIKIDRAFVGDLGKDESALAVVRAILSLADSLKLHTVAEGIETSLQAKVLRELGCDEFQGYLFHKPMSVAAFSLLDGVQPASAVV